MNTHANSGIQATWVEVPTLDRGTRLEMQWSVAEAPAAGVGAVTHAA